MKSNEELQKDVLDAIKWEPLLHAAEIGVTAKDGVVTLTGVVDKFAKKEEAETAAKNVLGVNAVVEKIKVYFNGSGNVVNDNEIASRIIMAFKNNWQVPENSLKVTIERGWVTLSGELPFNYQKEAALMAVKNLTGVAGVSDEISVRSEEAASTKMAEIQSALKRNWTLYNKNIDVLVDGHKVILTGAIDSFFEKKEAEKIAMNAPGIWEVQNDLVVNSGKVPLAV